jgi:hypothetical protein
MIGIGRAMAELDTAMNGVGAMAERGKIWGGAGRG